MEKAAKEMGLTVNENKTKFIALNGPAYSNLMHNRSFMIELYNFVVVTEFVYLGTIIDCKNDLEEENKRRIIIGNGHCGTSKLMKSRLLKMKTKCQLYKTIILPAVLYGSESCTLSKAHEALLGGFERN
jgi:hypothetical protein